MDQIVTAVVSTIFFITIAYIIVKTIQAGMGITRAIILALLTADIYVVMLLLMGLDRPLFILHTRLGSQTITVLEAFLLVKIPLTLYITTKRKPLEKILD